LLGFNTFASAVTGIAQRMPGDQRLSHRVLAAWRLDHKRARGPNRPPTDITRNASNQLVDVLIPPPASNAMPTAQPPAAESPNPTMENRAIVVPLKSGWALADIPDVRAPASAGIAMEYAINSASRIVGDASIAKAIVAATTVEMHMRDMIAPCRP